MGKNKSCNNFWRNLWGLIKKIELRIGNSDDPGDILGQIISDEYSPESLFDPHRGQLKSKVKKFLLHKHQQFSTRNMKRQSLLNILIDGDPYPQQFNDFYHQMHPYLATQNASQLNKLWKEVQRKLLKQISAWYIQHKAIYVQEFRSQHPKILSEMQNFFARTDRLMNDFANGKVPKNKKLVIKTLKTTISSSQNHDHDHNRDHDHDQDQDQDHDHHQNHDHDFESQINGSIEALSIFSPIHGQNSNNYDSNIWDQILSPE